MIKFEFEYHYSLMHKQLIDPLLMSIQNIEYSSVDGFKCSQSWQGFL